MMNSSLYRRKNILRDIAESIRAVLPEWAVAGSNHQTNLSFQQVLFRDIKSQVIAMEDWHLSEGINPTAARTILFVDVMRQHGKDMPYNFQDAYARAHKQAYLNSKNAGVPYWRTMSSLVFGSYMNQYPESYREFMKRIFLVQA